MHRSSCRESLSDPDFTTTTSAPRCTARPPEADIRAAALAKGMQLMRDDGERLIAQGVTSREEVLRVTRD